MEPRSQRSWKLFSWPRVGIVDVGSNAIRLTIAEVSFEEIIEIESERFSLRLGKDVFNNGRTIGSVTQANLIDIFREIKKIFQEYKVDLYRVVATSALRSARNRKRVLTRVLQHTGLQIELIGPQEEGRLIGTSLRRHHLAPNELVMDLGGGSLELALYEKTQLKEVTSLPLGAVRLLGKLKGKENIPDFLCGHIALECERNPFFSKFVKSAHKNLYVIGSGGNIRALYRMRKNILGKNCSTRPQISLQDLRLIIQRLEKLTPKQREDRFDLARDRADVILPAAYVFHEVLTYLGIEKIFVPMNVSLRQGALSDLQAQLF